MEPVRMELALLMNTMSKKFATPTTLTSTVFFICIAGLFVFGQDVRAQSATPGMTADDVFKYFGYVSVGLSALTVAVAAVFTIWRKSALAEWKELAETRKGKNAELQLEIAELQKDLERANTELERLEKLNLRLQDDRKV
jgi:hypothetical protein